MAPDAPNGTPPSTQGELSTLRSQLEELTRRITDVAERYRDTENSQIASDLFGAERALIAARRSLDRASSQVAD